MRRGWILMLLVWFTTFCLFVLLLFNVPQFPRCQEDEVLVGVGHFIDGRWTSYVCGPAVDDCEVQP